MAKVKRIKLGSQGLEVSAQGLGCMGMSAFYGPAKPESDMIALIHHAINAGVTFLDTSDVYGPFTNEILLGKVCFWFLWFGIFLGMFVLDFSNDLLRWVGVDRRSEGESRAGYEIWGCFC